jgi:HTH-type transcriptional regulator / antitoxin HigA
MQDVLSKAMEHWEMVAPVIQTPKTPEEYQTLIENINDAIDIANEKQHPAMATLIKSMANAANEYEQASLIEQELKPIQALRYLIKLHDIKQSELKEIGSQGVVSEVLNGKRSLTLRHVKALAKKFNVSPNVFIEIY